MSLEEFYDRFEYNLLEYKKVLSEKYFCKYCKLIYTDVYQSESGCHYCSKCLDVAIESGICQICQETFSEKKKIKDKAFQKELNNLIIDCIACDWNGRLVDYIKHFCETHELYCKFCKNKFSSLDTLLVHLNNNPKKTCQHTTDCIFKSIGCDAEIFDSKQLNEHMTQHFSQHLETFFHFLNSTQGFILKENSQISNRILNNQQHNLPLQNDSDKKMMEALTQCYLSEEKLKEELQICKNETAQLNENIKDLRSQLVLAKSLIIELNQRLTDQAAFSYGSFLWKITNVKEKILDSKSGKQTSYYSSPFYSHINGYKMCARIYLNGDGMGRGTHVSVFFVLMKGEYDSLLTWPFQQKVTFVLIDQLESESKENIVDAFRPDPKSISFAKPISDMNIASGIPLFCPIPKLNSVDHQYIKDDTIFIKIIVDAHKLIDI